MSASWRCASSLTTAPAYYGWGAGSPAPSPAPTTRPSRWRPSPPGLTANDTIAQTRQGRVKYGFYLNLEQELTDDIGLFGRFSWNDGRTEIDAFTDIDTSLSLGLSFKGTEWKWPDDRIGISRRHQPDSADHSGYLGGGRSRRAGR